mgnify:CR=1 FL=1
MIVFGHAVTILITFISSALRKIACKIFPSYQYFVSKKLLYN